MQHTRYFFQFRFIRNAINLAWNDPVKFVGIIVGTVFFTGSVLYKYGLNFFYRIKSVMTVPYFNEKIAEFAIKENNAILYGTTATIAEQLNKILLNCFTEVDPNKALNLGIKNLNLAMVYVAVEHKANLNKENEDNIRPVELALNKGSQDERGYGIAMHLILKDTDLSKSTQNTQENLFHKIIKSGKTELVEEAMKQAVTNSVLINSNNAEGNTIAHLMPVSSDLQKVAQNTGLLKALTSQSVSIANLQGKTAIDVIMYAYKEGKDTDLQFVQLFTMHYIKKTNFQVPKYLYHLENPISSLIYSYIDSKISQDLIRQYVELGTHNTIHPHFGCLVQWFNSNSNIVNAALSKHEFNFNAKDRTGRLPLDYALQFGDDDLSNKVVLKTNPNMLKNSHLWFAYQRSFQNTQKVLSQSLLQNDQSTQNFLLNPTGKNTGTMLHYMADGTIQYDKAAVLLAYYAIKKSAHVNPLQLMNNEGLNVLTLAKTNNEKMYFQILNLITSEGIQRSHVPLLLESYPSLVTLLMESIRKKCGLPIKHNMLSSNEKKNNLILDNIEKIEQFRAYKKESQYKIQQSDKEQYDQNGIPKKIMLKNIQYVQTQTQQEGFIIGGMLTKQLVMYKEFFISGEESIFSTLIWSGVFFVGGYCEAYGGAYQKPLVLAFIGAGTYCYTELFRKSLHIEHTPSEERNIFDFFYKYGDYIIMGASESILYQIAFAATGGMIGGWPEMLKSTSIVVGIRVMQSYDIYTTNPIDLANPIFDITDCIADVLAVGVALYVGWYFIPVLSSSREKMIAKPSAFNIGMFTLNALSAYSKIWSTFIVAKLTSSTCLSITKSETFIWVENSVKESVQNVAIKLNESYKTMLGWMFYIMQLDKNAYGTTLDYYDTDNNDMLLLNEQCLAITPAAVFREEICYADDLMLNF